MSFGSRTKSALRISAISTTVAALMGGALVVTPAAAADAPLTLISTANTTWNYLEDNTDPAGSNADVNVWTTTAFDDAAWKTGTGSFGAKNGAKTGIGPHTANTLLRQYINGTSGDDTKTFFFRADIELTADQLAGINGLAGTVVHDDALRVFVNGTKVAGVDDSSVTTNLQYAGDGASDPKSSDITVAKNLLREGTNTVSVALYQDRASSSDIYLDFKSLVTVPTPDGPVAANISDVVLNIGADETKRNFAWYSDSGATETVQVAKKSDAAGSEFPAAKAASFVAENGATTAGNNLRFQHADATGLVENTTYLYRVGSDAGWSKTYEFATQDFDGDYSFLLVGDPQIGASGNVANDQAGWTSTLNTAEREFPETEFIYSAGDQVENAGSESQYDAFLAPTQLTRYPIATINGNHDVGSKAYEQHYNMPNWDPTYGAATSGSSSGGDHWFMYNDVLYITLNSNSQDTASHKAFMEQVIDEHGADAKWKVVGFHHSIFSVASHANDTDIIARRSVLPTILSDLGIDLVLMGHDHVYTRSYLMDGNTVAEAPGAKAKVTAKEGEVLYVTANSASGSKYYDIRNQTYDFAAVTNQEKIRNFSNVEVSDSAITVTTYRSDAMTEVDKVTLTKADVAAPEITVPTTNDITVGDSFDALAGVTATDAVDGDVTAGITVTGTVDTTTVGSYPLVYSVTDAAGNTATAERTIVVGIGTLVAPKPTFVGEVRVGKTLQVVPGEWTAGTALSYSWAANGVTIPGATSAKFKLTAAQAAKKITATVTGTKTGYTTATVTSDVVAVPKGIFNASKPKITGTLKVGKTLKVSVGTWSPKASYTYAWYANGKAVKGATKSSVTLTSAWKGKTVTVRVTGNYAGYEQLRVLSSKTKAVTK